MKFDLCGLCGIEYWAHSAYCSDECFQLRNVKRVRLEFIAKLSARFLNSLQIVEQRKERGGTSFSRRVFLDGKAIRMPRKCKKSAHDDCNHPRKKYWRFDYDWEA